MKPIYAESYGMVYRFAPSKWRKMLREVKEGREVNYNDYGQVVCIVGHNITELNAEMAADILEEN